MPIKTKIDGIEIDDGKFILKIEKKIYDNISYELHFFFEIIPILDFSNGMKRVYEVKLLLCEIHTKVMNKTINISVEKNLNRYDINKKEDVILISHLISKQIIKVVKKLVKSEMRIFVDGIIIISVKDAINEVLQKEKSIQKNINENVEVKI